MANKEYRIAVDVCRTYRQNVLKVTQEQVANDLEYSQENISAFENGRNCNSTIFMWYVKNGILNYYSLDEICGGVEDVERPI